jgi:glutamine kinase
MSISIPNTPFVFGTKAQTLARLTGRLNNSHLCEQEIVELTEWQSDRQSVLRKILSRFASRSLVIRSSARHEDTAEASNAGAFLSVIGVEPNPDAIAVAIERVSNSYDDTTGDQEVLVQPLLTDIALSGVLMTRDLDTGAPYYVINYDDFSGRTDTVTSGAISKTVLVYRTTKDAIHSPRMRALIDMAQNLECVTASDELDIEFCMTANQRIYVLQVRPLAARAKWHFVPDHAIDAVLTETRTSLERLMRPADGLAGKTTVFGEMADWNPAEMIGNAPRPLAYSLYRKLITDGAWAEARAVMGYRHIPRPLMTVFAGRPYIDIRLSLNSFLPADINPNLAHRLVDHQLDKLSSQPDLHDKIEFDIAITCRDFEFDLRSRELSDAGFSQADVNELEVELQRLTAKVLSGGRAGQDALLGQTNLILEANAHSLLYAPLARARLLLERTIEHGTIPFSILARHSFIAISFLRSLVSAGAFSAMDAETFLRGVRTVASDLVDDMAAMSAGVKSESAFLNRYGHLRPGTYDIQSWRYDERPDLYLGQTSRAPDRREDFVLSQESRARIQNCLSSAGYSISPEALIDFMTAAVAAREQAKFAFTRGVSDALVALGEWGADKGLLREDLSFLPIDMILGKGDDSVLLHETIARHREEHRLTRAVRLPHLICEPDDINVVRLARGQPTFITNALITARIQLLHTNEAPPIDGLIILIESADPGFDWIFSHGIAGLITKYGGANSHMAIRCAEFGLPAAIGCGERTFDILTNSSVIELNCAARSIRATG